MNTNREIHLLVSQSGQITDRQSGEETGGHNHNSLLDIFIGLTTIKTLAEGSRTNNDNT